MKRGWAYRGAAAGGTAVAAAGGVLAANHPLAQRLFGVIPVAGTLPATTFTGTKLVVTVLTATVVTTAVCLPLFRPRPRRMLDAVVLAVQRILLGAVALAAVGYFDYTYRLPRSTLVLVTGFLLVVLPAWFVAIRPRPATTERAVVVGDDPDTIADILAATAFPVVGYVSPPGGEPLEEGRPGLGREYADGGTAHLGDLPCLGGLSSLERVLVRHDVDTAVLAFSVPDRAEFFSVVDTCDRVGVTAKVHREHADAVLTTGLGGEKLVDVDLDPWDPQDRVLKRAFDVTFAVAGLVALAPVVAAIAVAIRREDGGPILYTQERTAEFGERFTVYKFRSMVPDAESGDGPTLSPDDRGERDPRVTDVGGLLRATHLDELPQLWSVLRGDMSVVGPRPERPALDEDIERDVGTWRRRWFVKPGLTGLAQVRGVTGHDPAEKLRDDVAYIRRQSFWFDLKLVSRQVYQVLEDVREVLAERDGQ
jgi:lipopolysaccharide/colanic/teichoic acid biosynthesis glycosyltransferase